VPEADTAWLVSGVVVAVLVALVFSQYIVPPVPPVALSVSVPQNVPAPLTVTAVGIALTVISWLAVALQPDVLLAVTV
jgi:hypothetical protein